MDKVLPHNIELEQKILGQIFFDNKIFPMIMAEISPSDFYVEKHSKIYTAMEKIYSQGGGIDAVTVCMMLSETDLINVTHTYVSQLEGSEPTSYGYEVNVKMLKEFAVKRQMIRECEKATQYLYGMDSDPNLAASKLTNKILAANTTKSKTSNMAEMLAEALQTIEGRYNGTISKGMESGISDLDNLIGNFEKKELIFIGARPSMGKTTLTMNILKGLARNYKGLFFSLEQPKEQLMYKLLASETWINGLEISKGDIQENDFTQLVTASDRLMKLNLQIDDTSKQSVKDIQAAIIKEKQTNGLDFVAIDYLQYMDYGEFKHDANRAITEIVKQLKHFVKEYDINMIVLSQLSRALEQRQDKRPIMSDLRESGAIEQEADKILFLYRDEYYNKETEDKNILEVNIAKNRNGNLGIVKLAYLPQYQTIGSLDNTHSLDMKI